VNCAFCKKQIVTTGGYFDDDPVCIVCSLKIELRECIIENGKLIPFDLKKKYDVYTVIKTLKVTPQNIKDLLEWFSKRGYDASKFSLTMKALFIENIASTENLNTKELVDRLGLSYSHISKLRKQVRENPELFGVLI